MTKIVCHPEAFEALNRGVGETCRDMNSSFIGGVRIDTNPNVPKHPTKWQWSHERFFEYEDSDREWCEYFGIGGSMREDATEYVYYRFEEPALSLSGLFVPSPPMERKPMFGGNRCLT